MVLGWVGAVGSALGCCRMLLSWEKAAALGGRSPPAWEPAGQGEAQSAQTCSQSFPAAGSSPKAGALNGSFQSFPPCPSSLCPTAQPEPPLCSLFKNKSFWDEFHASEQCQPGRGRDVRIHYSVGMRGSRRQSSSWDAEHPALLHCGGNVPSLGAAVTSPALLGGPQAASHGLGPPQLLPARAWHCLLGRTGMPRRKD